MGIYGNNKWAVRLGVLIIFALGFVSGAMSWNIYRLWGHGGRSFTERRFDHIIDRLDLNAEQKPQVEKILSETRKQLMEIRKESEPKMREIREQTDQRLKAVLTPEQWVRFKQMRDEMRGHHRFNPEGPPVR